MYFYLQLTVSLLTYQILCQQVQKMNRKFGRGMEQRRRGNLFLYIFAIVSIGDKRLATVVKDLSNSLIVEIPDVCIHNNYRRRGQAK
jgi:hypothetical protein